jgi:cell division protein FtsQ
MKNNGKKHLNKKTPKHARPMEAQEPKVPKEPKEPKSMGIYFIIIFVMLIFAAALIGWDKFTIRTIKVNGIDDVNYNDVIRYSGIQYKKNIFAVDINATKEKIANNPLLEVQSVKRILPSTIEINVIERKPIATIEALGKKVILNSQCIVVGEIDQNTNTTSATITGVTLTSYKPGEVIKVKSEIKVEILQQLLKAIESTDISKHIKSIDMTLTENIKLETHEGYDVKLGNIEKIEKKCKWIKFMIPYEQKRGNEGGTLYTTNVETAHYIDKDSD